MKKNNYFKNWYYLIFPVLFLLFLRALFFFKRVHYLSWDESVYIGVGKYLWSFGSQGLWEVIRPIGLPFVLGFIDKFGLGVIGFDILILLFSIGVVVLCYLLCEELFDNVSGIVASIVLVLTPLFFFSSLKILTSIPAMFFILLSLYLFVKEKNIFVVGMIACLAFLFRFPAGIVLLVLFFCVIFRFYGKWKELFVDLVWLGLGFGVLFVPWCVFNYIMNHQYVDGFILTIFRPVFLGGLHQSNVLHSAGYLFYFVELFKNNPLLVLGVLGFFVAIVKKKSVVVYLALLLPLLYFTLIVNKQLRFSLLFLPFICMFVGYGFSFLYGVAKKNKLVLLFSLSMLFLVMFSYTVVYPGFVDSFRFFPEEEPEIVNDFYMMFDGGVILSTDPVFTAYTDLRVIPFYNNVTDAMKIYVVERGNYDYVVYDHDFYPCFDEECEIVKAELFKKISEENTLMLKGEYGGRVRYVFEEGSLDFVI